MRVGDGEYTNKHYDPDFDSISNLSKWLWINQHTNREFKLIGKEALRSQFIPNRTMSYSGSIYLFLIA
jgi:hypothetical protein